MNGRPWTEAEDIYVLDTPHLSARTVAEHLGRGKPAVDKRRQKLAKREGTSFTGYHALKTTAWEAGPRRLLARTCRTCGLFLDASWFLLRRDNGYRFHDCRSCCTQLRGRAINPSEARQQAFTVEHAQRAGEEYTEADLAILADPRKTAFQMALETSRTLYAVKVARQKMGLADLSARLGDPSEAQWIIRFPEREVAR